MPKRGLIAGKPTHYDMHRKWLDPDKGQPQQDVSEPSIPFRAQDSPNRFSKPAIIRKLLSVQADFGKLPAE
jgi:hypothetical protein